MQSSLVLLLLHLLGNVKVALSQNECSTLPDVPHGHVSEESKKAEYQQGDVIRFTCETGYISGLTIKYMCSPSGGGWLAVRQGKCYLKPCQLPDDTPNGYYQIIVGEDFVFGTTVKYFCNEGYQMISRQDTRTCLLDKWTNHVPICEPLSCDPPPTDEGVTVKGLPDNDNAILPDRFLTFSCDGPGKYLNGSTMLVCGKDGQWNHPFPSCEDITCELDILQPHLHVVGQPPENETMKIGHKLRFHCDQHYTLEGSKEIECLQTGKWNHAFPTCAGTCKVAGLSGSVRLTTHVPNNQLRKGQTLTFECMNSGEALRGNAVIECLGDGQWSDPFPTCGAPLGCGKPPPLADGDTKDSARFRYVNRERVEYICQRYYTMEGEPFKTCLDGEWIGQMRCLKPCTVDQEAMDLRNIEFRYGHASKLYSTHNEGIYFNCKKHRRLVGTLSLRQKCIDGVMHLPTCQ